MTLASSPYRYASGAPAAAPSTGDPSPVGTLLTTGNFAPDQTFQTINDGGLQSVIDNLIKGGAIAGTGTALAGATGLLGATTVGPGAAALGASDVAAPAVDPLTAAITSGFQAGSSALPIPGSEQAGQGLTLLPATNAASAVPLDPATQQMLGIDFSLAGTGGTGFDTSLLSAPAAGGATDVAGGATGIAPTALTSAGGGAGGYLDALGNFVTNPKNLATLGFGALSLVNALSKPKLPSQAGTVSATNTTASNAANAVISGGGTASPNWAQQKSSIDASIAQQLQQQSEALQQNAANTGQQGMVVQQQLNALRQTLETQRQQLYQQAQAANVNQAISELTDSNAALTGIANLQLQQDQAAQQASNQLAELALLLASKG